MEEDILGNATNENKTIRRFVLDEANKIVNCDRNEQYGEPEDNFATIAKLWSAYLDVSLYPMDVAIMMTLFKIGRIEAYPDKADSWIDAVGYIACGAEIALK